MRHALGFDCGAFGFISGALCSQARVFSVSGKDQGEVAPLQEQAAQVKRSLVGLLHAAGHYFLPHLWCVAVVLTLTEFSLGEMLWKEIFPKIIMLFLVDSFQSGAS